MGIGPGGPWRALLAGRVEIDLATFPLISIAAMLRSRMALSAFTRIRLAAEHEGDRVVTQIRVRPVENEQIRKTAQS